MELGHILTIIGMLTLNGVLLLTAWIKMKVMMGRMDLKIMDIEKEVNNMKIDNDKDLCKLEKKFDQIDQKLDTLNEKITQLMVNQAKKNQ